MILYQEKEKEQTSFVLWRMLENQLIILKTKKYRKESSIYPTSLI